MTRPYCQQPSNCVAGKRGACSLCQRGSFVAHAERLRKLHADPAFAAANAERLRKLGRAKALPLTADQRRVYAKLRRIVGRESALAVAGK